MFKVVSCDFFWDVGKSIEVMMRRQGLIDIKREKEGEYEAFMGLAFQIQFGGFLELRLWQGFKSLLSLVVYMLVSWVALGCL